MRSAQYLYTLGQMWPFGYLFWQQQNSCLGEQNYFGQFSNLDFLGNGRNEVKLTTVSKAPFSYLCVASSVGILVFGGCLSSLATRHHYHLYHHLDAVARAKRVADCLPLCSPLLCSAFFTTSSSSFSLKVLTLEELFTKRKKILQSENVVAFSTE